MVHSLWNNFIKDIFRIDCLAFVTIVFEFPLTFCIFEQMLPFGMIFDAFERLPYGIGMLSFLIEESLLNLRGRLLLKSRRDRKYSFYFRKGLVKVH